MNYRTFRLLGVMVLAIGLPSAAMGQSKGPGSTNPSRTTTAAPSTLPSSGSNLAITLSGNVVTQDGSSPSEPVAIERVCNGRVVREGRSDFKGYFIVSIGPGSPRVGDSETTAETTGGGFGLSASGSPMSQNPSSLQTLLMGCELRGSLAGFRSSSLRIPMNEVSGTGMVNVGTIVLERMEKAQGATVSATSLNAPKNAKKAYDKGHRAVENNKLPEAQQNLEKAVQLYPRYAAA